MYFTQAFQSLLFPVLVNDSTHLIGYSAGIFQLDIADHPDRLRIGLQSVEQHPRHVHPVSADLEEKDQLRAG